MYLARTGDAAAAKELDEAPECPEEFQYLVNLAYKLVGRSGAGMMGLAPLNPLVLESWLRQMDMAPLETWEVEALMMLDNAIRSSDTKTEDAEEIEQPQERRPDVIGIENRWPRRREGIVPQFQPRED